MTKIFNTFSFEPKINGDFGTSLELTPADKRGSVFIKEGVITVGKEIIEQIKKNSNNIFLVNKTVFEYLISHDIKNICMWDVNKTSYGKDTIQGGVIFA